MNAVDEVDWGHVHIYMSITAIITYLISISVSLRLTWYFKDTVAFISCTSNLLITCNIAQLATQAPQC